MSGITTALIVALTANFITSCGALEIANGNNANTSATNVSINNNPPNDDLGELLTIVRLPELPEETVWREETMGKGADESRVPGPTDRKLTAVLHYDEKTAAKLVEQISKAKPPEAAEVNTSNWFPAELIAQSQMSGNETLKGISYGVNDFTNVPYGSGRITRIENTNFFVLELYTS